MSEVSPRLWVWWAGVSVWNPAAWSLQEGTVESRETTVDSPLSRRTKGAEEHEQRDPLNLTVSTSLVWGRGKDMDWYFYLEIHLAEKQ